MAIDLPSFEIKVPIRETSIGNFVVGADSSLPFMSENSNKTKPLFALEIPYFVDKNYPPILKDYWGEADLTFEKLFNSAQNTECDFICIHINVEEEDFKERMDVILSNIKSVSKKSKKQLIFKGTGNKTVDKVLLPAIASSIETPAVIAYAEESTYEDIVPAIAAKDHVLVLRTPIDINLAKELNILSIDGGLSAERILIDADMGALGYGLDYGYSIIEKIRQAAFEGDSMLNMPVITFVGAETFKTKESKSDKYAKNWGELQQRAIMWEVSTATAVIGAGSNIVVLFHPESIKTLKELLWN